MVHIVTFSRSIHVCLDNVRFYVINYNDVRHMYTYVEVIEKAEDGKFLETHLRRSPG